MKYTVEVQRDEGNGRNRIQVSDTDGLLCADTGERNSPDEDLSCTLKNLYFAIERIAELEEENEQLRGQIRDSECYLMGLRQGRDEVKNQLRDLLGIKETRGE